MNEPPEVVALGETMLSLVSDGAPLGDADSFVVTHGGGESNACVGLVRTGLRAAWVGRLGQDPQGDHIAAALAREGVDLRWVRRDPDRPTGLMLRDTVGGVRYYRAGSAASVLDPDDLVGVPFEDARAVLVTGTTALLGVGPAEAALVALGRATGLRVVDPNLRRGLWGSDRAIELVTPLIGLSDIVLGGGAELRAFAGDHSDVALARAVTDLGPREVVIKRGSAGAAVLDHHGDWFEIAPAPGPDVDPVGAGDAFNAGYIAARLAGTPAPLALELAARCGAAVAGTLGDTEGFPEVHV